MKRAILFILIFITAILNAGAYTVYTVTKITDPDPYNHPYSFDDTHCDPEMFGTLQWAIRKSMETPGECKIHFNIAGNGPFTIELSNALPSLEKNPVFIDGSTQPGYAVGNPMICIDGRYRQISGLYFNNLKASGLKGIVFKHFISQAVVFNYCDLYQISDCYFIENGSGDSKIEPAVIRIIHSTNGTITGNKVGVDPAGNEIGNEAFGIVLTDYSNNNTIGSITPDKQNLVVRNKKFGIWVTKESKFDQISGNIIYGQDIAISLEGGGNQSKACPEIREYIGNTGLLSGSSAPFDTIEAFGSMGYEMSNFYLGETTADNSGHWTLPNVFTTADYFTTTATDQDRNTSRLSEVFTKSIPINVDFSINPDTANVGQSVTFTNTSGWIDTTQYYFVWAFEMPENDSSNNNVIYYDTLSGRQSIEKQYMRSGHYSVSLFLINRSHGISETKERFLDIRALSPSLSILRNGSMYGGIGDVEPGGNGTINITVCKGDNLEFILDGDTPQLDSWWQFVGGPCDNISDGEGGAWQNTIPASFSCTLSGVVGNCYLNVQVGYWESNTVYYTYIVNIHVIDAPRPEYFTISPSAPVSACPEESVILNYVGNTYDYPIDYHELDIIWGDGSIGFYYRPPTHEYYECGNYNISINASNMCGSMPMIQYPVTVELKPDFQAQNLCLGETFCPTGTLSCPENFVYGGTLEWSWDFGDGSLAVIGQNPCHTYLFPGNYHVTLTLKFFLDGVLSCTGNIVKQIVISPLPSEFTIDGTFHNCNSGSGFASHYNLTGAQSGIDYAWQFPFGMGSFVGSTVPNVINGLGLSSVDIVWNETFNLPQFELIVIGTDPTTGCSSSDTLIIYQCCRPTQNQASNIIWTDQILTSSINLSDRNIYVNGVVRIKETSDFSNCNFFMGPNSKIIIGNNPIPSSNPVVQMITCDLFSCDHINSWDGVFVVDPNAKLAMAKTCTAKEARNAIVSENGGKYNIQECQFDLNWKSLWVKPYNVANNSIFEWNTITCSNSSNMLFPYNNRRSYVGVDIDNNAHIVIGYKNTFSNLGMGIHVIGSNTVIKGNTFNNMLISPMQFFKSAIWIQGNSPGFATSVQENNVFNKCYEGIIAESGTDITIIDNKFSNISHNAIYYKNLKGNNVVISRNTITNAGNGIFAYKPGPSKSTISFNTISWTSNNFGTGIKIFGTNDINEKVTVGLLNSINATKATKGIWMMNVEKPVIDNNIITLQNKPNSWLVQRGIHLQDCPGASVTDNSITATGNPTATNTSYGISIELSESSSILCNKITKTGFAIQASGECNKSRIYNNRMKQAYYGFSLSNAGRVGYIGGMNFPSDNTWTGVSEPFWSFYSNGADSPFTIRATPSAYNPVPPYTQPGTIGGVAITTNIGGIGKLRYCEFVWPHPIDDLIPLEQIAQNQNTAYVNNISEIWLSKKALRKIIQYDTTLQNDPILMNYFDSTSTQSIGILDSVLYKLRNEEFMDAYTLNNFISDTNLLERNEKLVNAIEINHLLTNSDYSQIEIDELRELSIKCPFTDGKAVYRARTLLVEVDSFNTEYKNECEQMMALELRSMEANADSSAENTNFVIYPNPSNGIITITCSQVNNDKQFSFELFNMVGQSMKATTVIFTSESAQINIDELSNGVYYYRLSDQAGAIESGKIVLLKP